MTERLAGNSEIEEKIVIDLLKKLADSIEISRIMLNEMTIDEATKMCKIQEKKQEELKKSVVKLLKLAGENYQCVITMERSYVGR